MDALNIKISNEVSVSISISVEDSTLLYTTTLHEEGKDNFSFEATQEEVRSYIFKHLKYIMQ